MTPWIKCHGVFFVYRSRPRSVVCKGNPMKLSIDEVRHVAELAKLELSDEEINQYAGQLSAILNYAEQIQGVDTSSVPPTPYVLPVHNVMRDDSLGVCLPNETAVANAADAKDGYFRVRAVFEE